MSIEISADDNIVTAIIIVTIIIIIMVRMIITITMPILRSK